MRLIHIEKQLQKIFGGNIKVKKFSDYISLDITNNFTSYHDSFPSDWDDEMLLDDMIESYFNYIFSNFFTKKACKCMKRLI